MIIFQCYSDQTEIENLFLLNWSEESSSHHLMYISNSVSHDENKKLASCWLTRPRANRIVVVITEGSSERKYLISWQDFHSWFLLFSMIFCSERLVEPSQARPWQGTVRSKCQKYPTLILLCITLGKISKNIINVNVLFNVSLSSNSFYKWSSELSRNNFLFVEFRSPHKALQWEILSISF